MEMPCPRQHRAEGRDLVFRGDPLRAVTEYFAYLGLSLDALCCLPGEGATARSKNEHLGAGTDTDRTSQQLADSVVCTRHPKTGLAVMHSRHGLCHRGQAVPDQRVRLHQRPRFAKFCMDDARVAEIAGVWAVRKLTLPQLGEVRLHVGEIGGFVGDSESPYASTEKEFHIAVIQHVATFPRLCRCKSTCVDLLHVSGMIGRVGQLVAAGLQRARLCTSRCGPRTHVQRKGLHAEQVQQDIYLLAIQLVTGIVKIHPAQASLVKGSPSRNRLLAAGERQFSSEREAGVSWI
jgi:hypothetical protein